MSVLLADCPQCGRRVQVLHNCKYCDEFVSMTPAKERRMKGKPQGYVEMPLGSGPDQRESATSATVQELLLKLAEEYEHPSGEEAMSPADYISDFLNDAAVHAILEGSEAGQEPKLRCNGS